MASHCHCPMCSFRATWVTARLIEIRETTDFREKRQNRLRMSSVGGYHEYLLQVRATIERRILERVAVRSAALAAPQRAPDQGRLTMLDKIYKADLRLSEPQECQDSVCAFMSPTSFQLMENYIRYYRTLVCTLTCHCHSGLKSSGHERQLLNWRTGFQALRLAKTHQAGARGPRSA